MLSIGAVIIGLAVLFTVGAILVPVARAVVRKIDADRRHAALPDDAAARIARMEAALESVAIEVERISEGQRFVTKLLAERRDDRPLPPGGDA